MGLNLIFWHFFLFVVTNFISSANRSRIRITAPPQLRTPAAPFQLLWSFVQRRRLIRSTITPLTWTPLTHGSVFFRVTQSSIFFTFKCWFVVIIMMYLSWEIGLLWLENKFWVLKKESIPTVSLQEWRRWSILFVFLLHVFSCSFFI